MFFVLPSNKETRLGHFAFIMQFAKDPVQYTNEFFFKYICPVSSSLNTFKIVITINIITSFNSFVFQATTFTAS